MVIHWSRSWSCTDNVTDHALITWLSCTTHVAEHALMTWLFGHWSRVYHAVISDWQALIRNCITLSYGLISLLLFPVSTNTKQSSCNSRMGSLWEAKMFISRSLRTRLREEGASIYFLITFWGVRQFWLSPWFPQWRALAAQTELLGNITSWSLAYIFWQDRL